MASSKAIASDVNWLAEQVRQYTTPRPTNTLGNGGKGDRRGKGDRSRSNRDRRKSDGRGRGAGIDWA